MIHGTSRHSRVVALVVAREDVSAEVVLEEMKAIGAKPDLQNPLRSFEIPNSVHVISEHFTVENGLLTQTSKLCRPKIRTRFKDVLEKLLFTTAEEDAKAAGDAKTDIAWRVYTMHGMAGDANELMAAVLQQEAVQYTNGDSTYCIRSLAT